MLTDNFFIGNKSLSSVGGETGLICSIPIEWYQKIMAKILDALKVHRLRALFPSDYAFEDEEL